MRFNEIKHFKGPKGQANGKGPKPKRSKPSRTGEQPHPLQGKLVGESIQLDEAEARIAHLEDLIFDEGSDGALRAVEVLRNMEQGGHEATTLKWDGSPAIIFGRNEAGEFVLSDKSGFNKATPERATSADEIRDFMLNRGGGKMKNDPGRIAFADKMASIFPLFDRAVPKDFKGYFKGDLLYYTTPPVKDGDFVFKPNPTGVDYAIDTKSDLGKKIAKSTTAVVIHRVVDEQGNEGPLKDFDIFQGNDVLVVPPVTALEPVEVDNAELDRLESVIKKDAAGIDELLNPQELRAKQMTDFPRMLYTYLNSKVDTGLTNLGGDFAKWLETAKVSDRKKAKVLEYIKQHMNAFKSLWHTVTTLQQVKNSVIASLDKQDHGVKQSINGVPGGEGYVIDHPGGAVKAVNRAGFTAASRAARREEN